MRYNTIIKTYNDLVDDFILDIQNELQLANVQFLVSVNKYVTLSGDNNKCNGYFDDSSDVPVLAISTGKPFDEWFPTLVHEYCHFTQWNENIKLWKANEHCGYVFEWIDGMHDDVDESFIHECIDLLRDLELDCEKRTAALIKKRHLPIDLKSYIKKANAYINFYNYIKENRKWYSIGKEPYSNKFIIECMSDKFNMDYSNLPNNLLNLYDDCI